MLEVKKIKVMTGDDQYEYIWKKLVSSMEYSSPFVSPEWILNELELNSACPYLLLVVDAKKVICILPLLLKKNHLGIRYLTYCGDQYHPDPLGLCCHPQNRRKSIQAICSFLREQNDWDVLLLKLFLHDESLEWKDMGAGIKKATVAPFMPLPERFDEYLSQFKRKKRYNLKAAEKKFDEAGGCFISGATYSKRLKLLQRLFALHEKRAVEKGIKSTFYGQDIIDFHIKVLSRMNNNIWLRALTFDESVVAVLYGFLFGNRFFYFQIAHDPEYGQYGLGTVLLFKVIRECCECGVVEFNFLQGGEEYKWKWTKTSRSLFNIEMYNNTFMATCAKAMQFSRSVVKRFYKFR